MNRRLDHLKPPKRKRVAKVDTYQELRDDQKPKLNDAAKVIRERMAKGAFK